MARRLRVATAENCGRTVRQVRLTGDELAGFAALPGQDLLLMVPRLDTPGSVRRRYSIRRFDPKQRLVDLVIVRDGSGPGVRWAMSARPGDHVDTVGPRGKIVLNRTARHPLFIGDETAIAGCFAMLEALGRSASGTAVLEVGDPDDCSRLPVAPARETAVRWVAREPGARGRELTQALSELDLVGSAFDAVYLAGEVHLVRAAKARLIEAGLPEAAIAAKAYWSAGVPNEERGEPALRV